MINFDLENDFTEFLQPLKKETGEAFLAVAEPIQSQITQGSNYIFSKDACKIHTIEHFEITDGFWYKGKIFRVYGISNYSEYGFNVYLCDITSGENL